MTEANKTLLLLELPNADPVFTEQLTAALTARGLPYERESLVAARGEAILDRLGPGVLPLVLKPRRHSAPASGD